MSLTGYVRLASGSALGDKPAVGRSPSYSCRLGATVEDRRTCSHETDFVSVIVVRWCARCAGWVCSRLGVPPGSRSAFGSLEVLESHFCPREETDPLDLTRVLSRALLATEEMALPERRF